MSVNRALIKAIIAVLLIGLAGAVSAAEVQTAYNGPHTIPGRVQAEDFDNGGAGVAYSDTTTMNYGGVGRVNEGVDVQTANGVTNLAWVVNNEWTEYTVQVASSGTYTVNFRVSSWSSGRKIALTVDGGTGCTVNVPNTGGYTAFTTVTAPLSLTAGTHVIRLTYINSGQNIDYFEILGGSPITTPTTIAATPSAQTPYNGPHTLPGRVEAEDYDNGGQNVAYSDIEKTNRGSVGRTSEAVDIMSSNGATFVSYIYDEEWTEYTVQVASGGAYTANFRVGAPTVGTHVAVTVDGAPGCSIDVPATGNYENFQIVSVPLSLTAGTHVIRLTYLLDDPTVGLSIDYFEVVSGGTVPVPTTVPTTVATTVPTTVAIQSPYNGPHMLPGRVEAEDYDNGGAGVAYSDVDKTNRGGDGRVFEAVDTMSNNGATFVSYIYDEEWTEYTVQVTSGGAYTANFRVGAPTAGMHIAVTVDGAPGCSIDVPATGDYETFQTVSVPISLTAGTHVIRLTYLLDDPTVGLSIDYFEVVSGGTVPVPTTVPTTVATTVPTGAPTTVPTTVASTMPTGAPTTVPTTVASTMPTGAPTTVPTTVTTTLGSSPSNAQLQAVLDSAKAQATSRLASMQSAARAWSVPAPSNIGSATNAKSSGLKNDGSSDNTASLQSLLNSAPSGAVIYFPAGTYRINGPISITKSVTLVGEKGTVFDCSRATQNVFTINRGGGASSRLSGVTFTGLVIEGPGIETSPEMVYCNYVQNLRFSYVKFHNVGLTAIDLRTCTDVTVQNCVFDNVFYTGEGYGVAICDHSDRIVVRDSFFVTKGRHGVMTGTANYNLPQEDYVRSVLVENNYFENMPSHAIDAHSFMIGPYTIRGNVIYNSNNGIAVGSGQSLITDNVIIDCEHGMDVRDASASASNARDLVENNKLININVEYCFYLLNSNVDIKNNVATGDGQTYGIFIGPYSPSYLRVEGNVFEKVTSGIARQNSGATYTSVNNFLKSGSSFTKF